VSALSILKYVCFTDDLAPPPYAEIVSQVKNIRETIAEVNGALAGSNTIVDLPTGFFRADVFQPTDAVPLRVLSLGRWCVTALCSRLS
jgi:hypothetical protein